MKFISFRFFFVFSSWASKLLSMQAISDTAQEKKYYSFIFV